MIDENIFEGVLISSDIDGTLLNRNKEIPQRSLDAISRFMRLGGRFSIASGRSPESVRPIALAAGANAACVSLNGAMVYDFTSDKPARHLALPENYVELLIRLHEEFPALGIQLYYNTSRLYSAHESEVTENLYRIEHLTPVIPAEHIIRGGMRFPATSVYKVLLGAPPELLEQVREAVQSRYAGVMRGMKALRTEVMYYEILPAEADKGFGIRSLSEIYGIPLSRIAAVGDYYNDLEMLECAGLPIVAENAPDDVKAKAKYIACDCDRGTVADAIEHIEKLIISGKF